MILPLRRTNGQRYNNTNREFKKVFCTKRVVGMQNSLLSGESEVYSIDVERFNKTRKYLSET